MRPLDRQTRARELFRLLVGRRFGIVRDISYVPANHDEVPMHHCGGRLANPHPDLVGFRGIYVGGSGYDKDEALLAALCEGVERYCAASYYPEQYAIKKYREMPHGAVDPRAIAMFSPQQYADELFPYKQPDADSLFRWICGENIATKEKVWAPLNAVFVPYLPDSPELAPLCPSHSTGLACGPDYASACLSALCEVIERDALTLTWLKCATPTKLSKEQTILQLPGTVHDDICLYDITSDLGIPVFLAVAKGVTSDGPIVYTGSACHPDSQIAIAKAVKEALQGRVYVRMLVEEPGDWFHEGDFQGVSDFSRHAQFYTRRPDLRESAFAFLDQAQTKDDLPQADGKSPLDTVVEALSAKGFAPRIFDISQPWTKQVGLVIIRVVLPELIALHGHHAFPLLGHPRLQKVQQHLPNNASCLENDEIHPYPHPFA